MPGVFEDITRNSIHDRNEQIQLEIVLADIVAAVAGPGSGDGKNVAGVCLSGFKEGTVYIAVDCSARLFYWKLRRGTILKRFQERRPDVTNIVFKIGKVI